MQVVTLGIGGVLVIRGDMTLGTLVAFLGLQSGVIGPILQLSQVMAEMQQATGGLQRVEEVLDEPAVVADAPDARPMPPFTREIGFEGVDFSHTREQPTLRGVSFTLPAGGRYALVGPSGCGKSTTLGLLMRLHDPAAGRVLIDGTDVRELTQGSVRAQMGVVLQDSFLFNLSVRENIRYGRLDATDAEIDKPPRRAAEIHEAILALPEGYETVAGERGRSALGRPAAAVGVARALVRDPALLLLDEATSALDPQTEAALNATLQRVGRGRTVISVTHRLDAVVDADRIVVFDRGQVIEQGSHAELLGRDGLYAQLWHQQHGSAGEVEARLLSRVPIFRRLSPPQLAALSRLVVIERFAAGDLIVREGEPGDKLYILTKGRVEVTAEGAAGPLAQAGRALTTATISARWRCSGARRGWPRCGPCRPWAPSCSRGSRSCHCSRRTPISAPPSRPGSRRAATPKGRPRVLPPPLPARHRASSPEAPLSRGLPRGEARGREHEAAEGALHEDVRRVVVEDPADHHAAGVLAADAIDAHEVLAQIVVGDDDQIRLPHAGLPERDRIVGLGDERARDSAPQKFATRPDASSPRRTGARPPSPVPEDEVRRASRSIALPRGVRPPRPGSTVAQRTTSLQVGFSRMIPRDPAISSSSRR